MTGDPSTRLRPLLIAVPFYQNERLVRPLTRSLLGCADEIRELDGEIVFFHDSPGYAPLTAALNQAVEGLRSELKARVEANPKNLGFVRTMNLAVAEAVERRCDLLLLNSDTVLFPGTLRHMACVAASDPMIAFVNPRSNNATLANFPVTKRGHALGPQAAWAAFEKLHQVLPAVSYVPTAVGFCLWCRWSILAEFGGFDEAYGAGYHEENDLVMRANRCGYRAALANKAFVWHAGEATFGTLTEKKAERDKRNHEILVSRYPEYDGLVRDYFESPAYHAERLLSALAPAKDGRLDIAFDLSAFADYHNGTFAAGRQLLAGATRWDDRFKIHAICSAPAYRFHNIAALGVPRSDPNKRSCYSAIFRVGQPYGLGELERLIMQAPVIGYYMLDTISIDCGALYSPRLYNVWQFALEHADLIATTSELTTNQFTRRFKLGGALQVRAMHSVDLDDYRSSAEAGAQSSPPQFERPYLLVVGNKFPHKYVIETANALAAAFPDQIIVALGVRREKGSRSGLNNVRLKPAPNLIPLPVGDLSEVAMGRLYADARAVIFPSHYEGFGFPLLDALVAETPIFARRIPALDEVWRLQGSNPNVRFFDVTSELVTLLKCESAWLAAPPALRLGANAEQSADAIMQGVEAALSKVSYDRIVGRIRALQFIGDIANDEGARRARGAAEEARGLSKRLDAARAEITILKQQMAQKRRLLDPDVLTRLKRALSTLHRFTRPPSDAVPERGGRGGGEAGAAPDSIVDLINRSGLFDAEWYLSTYPDVALSRVSPLQHFLAQGLQERRDPGPRFSTHSYVERHPEVFETDLNPLVHYLTVRRSKGAKPRR